MVQSARPQNRRRARRDRQGRGPVLSAAAPGLRRGRLYSPDMNPIEMAFSKLKTLLRQAAERTRDGLWQRLGALLDQFTPDECANYFQAAGYGHSI